MILGLVVFQKLRGRTEQVTLKQASNSLWKLEVLGLDTSRGRSGSGTSSDEAITATENATLIGILITRTTKSMYDKRDAWEFAA